MSHDTMLPFANHLWQSTLFAIAVWLITLTLRKNRAAVRHRLWLAATVKFLVPFSLLAGIGSHFQWETSVTTPPAVSTIVETISQPFSVSGPSVVPPGTASAPQASPILAVIISVWICGIAASLFWWFARWRQVRRAVRLAAPSDLVGPVKVMYGPARFEPGVFGVFRPVLLLPEGITQRLSPAQLQAVLAHELCHVRRRDNLATAIHMVVEALFWFHPLVWFIKARLIEEQERACDEEVLRLGGDPQVYAESILRICEIYLTSPLICVSGIAGSNLKKRIEDIMRNRVALKLSLSRALLLAVAAIVALAGPIIVGVARVKAGEVQSSELVVRPTASTIVIREERPSTPQTAQLQAAPAAPAEIATAPQAGRGWVTRGGATNSWQTPTANQAYRLGEVKINGTKVLHADLIRSLLGLVSGRVYNESKLRQGFENLKQLYGNLGYVNFLPEPELDFDEQQRLVNLTVNIDEGPQFTVNRISFTGNTTVPDEVIRREVLLKEGEVFNASLLYLSLSRLSQLGFFEQIGIEDAWIQPSASEPKVDVSLRVKEKTR